MDWVHCNKCFLKSGTKLYCGACCHILCKECVQKMCHFCGKEFKCVEIGSKMPLQVKSYFEDPIKAAQRLQKSIKFQWEHRQRIEANKARTVFPKLCKLQAERKTLLRAMNVLQENAKKESMRIKKMQAYIMQQKSFVSNKLSQASGSLISTPTISITSSGRESSGNLRKTTDGTDVLFGSNNNNDGSYIRRNRSSWQLFPGAISSTYSLDKPRDNFSSTALGLFARQDSRNDSGLGRSVTTISMQTPFSYKEGNFDNSNKFSNRKPSKRSSSKCSATLSSLRDFF